jgi:hypothetical protein
MAAVAGEAVERRQDPRAVKLLVAWFLDALAYKKLPRSNGDTHPATSYLPDITVSSLSLWFAVASLAGAVLDRRSAAAFEHRGANFCRESEAEEHRSRSRPSPSSFVSSTPRPRRRTSSLLAGELPPVLRKTTHVDRPISIQRQLTDSGF